MELVTVGGEHHVSLARVVAVVDGSSAAGRKMASRTAEAQWLDVTGKSKRRSLILLDTGMVVSSPVSAEAIAKRIREYDGRASRKGRQDKTMPTGRPKLMGGGIMTEAMIRALTGEEVGS